MFHPTRVHHRVRVAVPHLTAAAAAVWSRAARSVPSPGLFFLSSCTNRSPSRHAELAVARGADTAAADISPTVLQ